MEATATLINRGGSYLTETGIGAKIGGLTFQICGLIGVAVTTSCLTLRICSIRKEKSIRQLNVIHALMLLIYILGITFCANSLILVYGYGTESHYACHVAINTCLAFYLGQKVPLYIFLVERTHAVRSVTRTRLEDSVYISGIALVILGFGSILSSLFVWNVWRYDAETQLCWIGFGFKVATGLLAFDIFINLWLTAVFLYYLRPYLTKGVVNIFVFKQLGALFINKKTSDRITTQPVSVGITQPSLVVMIRKSILSSVGLCFTTTANIVIMIVLEGHEHAWWCFTICTVDVVWTVFITHWLTSTPRNLSNCQVNHDLPDCDPKPWSITNTNSRTHFYRHDTSILSDIPMVSSNAADQRTKDTSAHNGSAMSNHIGEGESCSRQASKSVIDNMVEEMFGLTGNMRAMNPSTKDGRRTSSKDERPRFGQKHSSRDAVVQFSSD